jgi:hypothetical protein
MAGNIREQRHAIPRGGWAITYISSRSEEFLKASLIDLFHAGDGVVKPLTTARAAR